MKIWKTTSKEDNLNANSWKYGINPQWQMTRREDAWATSTEPTSRTELIQAEPELGTAQPQLVFCRAQLKLKL